MQQKVIQVLDLRDSPWVDGPGRTILQCADMMDEEKCKIVIGGFSGDSHNDHAYIKKAKQLSLDIVTIEEKRSFDWGVIKKIKQTVEEKSIDIIHTHDFRSNIYGLVCAKSLGLPLVSTCHGWISNNLKGQIYTKIDRYLLRYHDKIITVSELMKKQLVQGGIDPNIIKVINNALVIEDYVIDKENRRFRDEFKIPHNKTVVANIGRLSIEKGQENYLKAAKSICETNSDFVFLIIGIGPEYENLVNMAKELQISDKVIFTGYREDMVNIYNGVDLVVQSSSTEGMPNVILESLLMEIPVIATDVGGTSQIVDHNLTGFLIEANNVESLKNAMTEYVKNKSHFSKMARLGRENIKLNYNQDNRVNKLYDVYHEIVH